MSARAETTSPVMDMVDLTPVEPGAGVPPWRDPRWLAEAVAWIDEQLAAVGLRRSSIPALRGRMWSVVARVPVGAHGTVWFKANPPGSAFEPGLIAALGQWAPGMVPPVLAVDTERAWMLASDAGSRLHEVLDRDPDPAHLIPVLQRYSRLQRDLSTRTGELLALGVPDLRPTTLPGRLETLLADEALLAAIGEPRCEALHGFLPELRERCAQLEAFGIAASLDHNDLHPNNVFGSGDSGLVFDWGDASIGNPFSTLLVVLRAAKAHFGAADLGRLRAAYLEPWLGDGYRLAELERAAGLAMRIAPISRATTWRRVFPCFTGVEESSASVARWLVHLLASDPLGEFELA